ncbi:MAG: endonuclease/exonuclease/phosphatase family protein [Gemmatimonadota bacterium]
MRPVSRAAARRVVPLLAAAAGIACGPGGEDAGDVPWAPASPRAEGPASIRVATFNVRELGTAALSDVDAEGAGRDPQALAAAAIVKRIRPDVLVLNEVDLDTAAVAEPGRNARRFAEAYLARGTDAIDYPFAFADSSNTGILSGLDLNGDGRVATDAERGTREHGDDSFGFGTYPGQYAMAVLSRFPIDPAGARIFRLFLWRDLPGNHLPPALYSPEVERALRLSSKSHWDLPVAIGADTLRLWVSHPTPPGFDGPEDRNGRRNFDEIRFWRVYLEGDPALVDDSGRRGGYASDAPFVIAGDLNARSGDTAVAYDGIAAVDQLLRHPRIQNPPGTDRPTAVFFGGIRIDYVLPADGLTVLGGGVYWPGREEDPEGARLAEAASDHRLVWVDLAWPPSPEI